MFYGDSAMNDFVSAAAVAAVYGVATSTVTNWAADGKIPTALKTPGGHRRFRLADVLDALPIEGVTAESAAAALAAEAQSESVA